MEVDFPSDSSRPRDDGAVKPLVDGHENQRCLSPVDEERLISAPSTCGFLGALLPPWRKGTPHAAENSRLTSVNAPDAI